MAGSTAQQSKREKKQACRHRDSAEINSVVRFTLSPCRLSLAIPSRIRMDAEQRQQSRTDINQHATTNRESSKTS